MLKNFIVIFFLILTCSAAMSQDILLETSKLRTNLHDGFSLSLIFPKEKKKDFQSFSYSAFPSLEDFTKTTTRYIEDKQSKNFKIVQHYTPLKAGIFKVYPFTISSDDINIESGGFTIHVANSNPPAVADLPELNFEEGNTEMRFQISADQKEVFAGEAVTITASLLISENNTTRFNFINLIQQTGEIARKFYPENSFLDESSAGIFQEPVIDSIQIGGITYQRIKFYENKFFPLSEGLIKFPAFSFQLLKYNTAQLSQTVYWKSELIEFSSKPFTLNVQPLPDHPLKGTVPVGKFSLKEGVSHNRVKTGKHFVYRAIITGEGNLATLTSPDLKENKQLDFYSPVLKQRIIKEGRNSAGKILEFTIIPKEPGTYRLSDYFRWVYFDPTEKNYDTLQSRMIIFVEGESQKDKEISSMDLGSFYELLSKESNKLRSRAKDESIKFFANIIILFMLVTTAILVLKRS